mmetsp:Transcript_80585/g.121081  ORF Transcript_80585/g.121081 Transcript_80585/m.121081 type:complete len:178 (-) Transcript_80585:64-597(-)|eukprot:CAMPEP_0117048598 /NCGR_PEP_ID=MMETSP0472-20121206/33594_1 /TAXON_ID=693140 ORGANISM="Tiarina fusus, Strain LIS" /NCGR_SAMPLE_ID=MMETSP0472 /ASSEMBLY_ACC=CAM_ASM_000603 /LENGTH=177 /DNA_ID=CAMNT_0004761759 /DNA_START=124 /DNA_END=657 /DNA_ORIENTATION=+
MDALAGYGSGSSSESEAAGQKKNPLSGLIGTASDDDDESSQDERPVKPPPTKRQRKEEPQRPSFPVPDTTKHSVTLWDTNYLSEKKQYTTDSSGGGNNQGLSDKLEKLAKSLKISWAHHLKEQHEFHNPHFFESVVEHFGITDPLGSQMFGEISRPLQPYEVELFPTGNKGLGDSLN